MKELKKKKCLRRFFFLSFFIKKHACLSAADMIQQVLSIATIGELKINVVFLHCKHHERTLVYNPEF
jgi:hypothetical protein